MSYILDALKKAERERGLTRVPILATIHSSREARRSLGFWAICAGLVVCTAVAIWFFLVPPSAISPSLREPLVRRATPPQTTPPAAESARGSDRLPATSPAISPSEGQRPPTGGASKGASGTLGRDPEAAARPNLALPGPPARASSPRTTEEPRPGARQPATPVTVPSPFERPSKDAGAAETAPQTARQPIPEVNSPPASAPQLAPLPLQPAAIAPTPPATPPPALPAPAAFATLQEAMAKMIVNVLVYVEAASERMVVINGKRYAQGDYIDGRYLVEDITPEGPVLGFRGERAILRP